MRHMAPHPDDSPDRVRLEVGLQLRFHRHRAGLSQTQVAAATGWSLSAISMYEQGNRQAGYAKLRRLAELYGCTVDDFFSEGHDPTAERLRSPMTTRSARLRQAGSSSRLPGESDPSAVTCIPSRSHSARTSGSLDGVAVIRTMTRA